MSETFQSVVYSGVEAQREAMADLLSEVGHQLQGADGGPRHADGDGDDGYVAQAEGLVHDDVAAAKEMLDRASGAVQDTEATMFGVPQDDASAAKDFFGELLGKIQGADKHAEGDPADAFYSTASDPQFVTPSGGDPADAFYSTASDPQFVTPSGDGFLPHPAPGTSPVPIAPPAFAPPAAAGSAGISLGDILALAGETAQATTAVANAASMARYPYGVPVGVPTYGVPVGVGVMGPTGPGYGYGEPVESIHRHRMGRFAHERPVIFLIALAAILYFLFLSEDSIWEKVSSTGSKSKKHDKVETFTEEIHTKRESVLGKPTFPSAPSPAPAEASSPAPMP
jgi:hypothetical protein